MEDDRWPKKKKKNRIGPHQVIGEEDDKGSYGNKEFYRP
jgi:hypothetical protein